MLGPELRRTLRLDEVGGDRPCNNLQGFCDSVNLGNLQYPTQRAVGFVTHTHTHAQTNKTSEKEPPAPRRQV